MVLDENWDIGLASAFKNMQKHDKLGAECWNEFRWFSETSEDGRVDITWGGHN